MLSWKRKNRDLKKFVVSDLKEKKFDFLIVKAKPTIRISW